MHVALLLVTLAVGYWVLTIAQSQQKPLGMIGRILGAIIVLVSLAGLFCGAMCSSRMVSCGSEFCAATPCSGGAKCMHKMMGGGCPGMEGCEGGKEKAPEAKK